MTKGLHRAIVTENNGGRGGEIANEISAGEPCQKKRTEAELTRRCQTATALTYFKLYRDIFRVLVHKKNHKR